MKKKKRATQDHTRRRKVDIKRKTNANMRNSAAPAIPRNVLRLFCFIKAIT